MWFLLTVAVAGSTPMPSWMEGCWETRETPTCREVWSAPRAGVALGHVVCEGGGGTSWEHLELTEVDGALTLTIRPDGQDAHAFPLDAERPGALVFADPEHDVPQRVSYTRSKQGLSVEVSGTPEGAEAPTSMTLSYWACGATEPPQGAPPAVEPTTCKAPDAWVSKQLRDAVKADARDREKASAAERGRRATLRRGLAAGAVASGAVCTPEDAWGAGLLLQRGAEVEDHDLAFQLLQQACDAGYPSACPHAAGAWDAFLVARGSPAWFGAAYKGDGGASCMVPLDPDSNDADRSRYGAPLQKDVAKAAWKVLTGSVPSDASYEALVAAGHTCDASGD